MNPGKMLQRQLMKLGMDPMNPPKDIDSWTAFLKLIDESYAQNEKQRLLNENTIEQAMMEMDRLNHMIQEQAEKQVQHTEEKLLQVVEAVPSIIAWVDANGVIVGGNEKLMSFFKSTELSIVGQSFQGLGFQQLADAVHRLVQSDKQELSVDLSFSDLEKNKYFKFLFKKFFDDQMIVLVGIDFTEDMLRNMELEKAQSATMASSRMALLGEMAAGIAHEINNPLAVINSIIYQVRKRVEGNDLEKIPERLDKMQATVMRITRIISGLRTFARDGEKDPFQSCGLKKIIDETLELAAERLKNLEIQLRIDDIPETFMLDCRATQLSQVILNLVGNARDAIQGLPQRWIHIGFSEKNNIVQLFVEDSGNGIPMEVQEKMFRPFFTTKEVGVGTGLGLSISIGIIQSHHGKMYIDNNSKNTRFVIEIPKFQVIHEAEKISA